MVSEVTEQRRREIFKDAMRVIGGSYGDPELGVDRIAFEALASRRQLQRVFEEAGTTVRKAICDVRMAQAATLLRNPGEPVAQVAHAVGYNQPAQFAKAFRRTFGASPTEWRTRQAERRGAGRPWSDNGAIAVPMRELSQVA